MIMHLPRTLCNDPRHRNPAMRDHTATAGRHLSHEAFSARSPTKHTLFMMLSSYGVESNTAYCASTRACVRVWIFLVRVAFLVRSGVSFYHVHTYSTLLILGDCHMHFCSRVRVHIRWGSISEQVRSQRLLSCMSLGI